MLVNVYLYWNLILKILTNISIHKTNTMNHVGYRLIQFLVSLLKIVLFLQFFILSLKFGAWIKLKYIWRKKKRLYTVYIIKKNYNLCDHYKIQDQFKMSTCLNCLKRYKSLSWHLYSSSCIAIKSKHVPHKRVHISKQTRYLKDVSGTSICNLYLD